MSLVRIYVHCVWTTKYREPVLTTGVRTKLFAHIRDNAKVKGVKIDCLNGYFDHIHVLLALAPEQSVAQVVKLIKGESTFWLNKKKLLPEPFRWQRQFFAESVSPKHLSGLRRYIKNQVKHHSNT